MSSMSIDSVADLVLLLLYANRRIHGRDRLAGTTRLQKLLFLLTKAPSYAPMKEREEAPDVSFEPYKMGPFAASVYDAVDLLANFNPPLVDAVAAERAPPDQTELHRYVEEMDLDATWPRGPRPATFSLTNEGAYVAERLWVSASPTLRNAINKVIGEYASMPIRELLRRVYAQYPGMTVRSEIKKSLELP